MKCLIDMPHASIDAAGLEQITKRAVVAPCKFLASGAFAGVGCGHGGPWHAVPGIN
ncbi:hypothetical protein [Variovorax sp. PAMC26660]|uniref:hypothetical protein n=1 Tax=Variovorax sp. PAMC26660 TaxID=2762322 RepID=UPI00164CE841|nr:hypothetical protein [Variovorax sp. PAMC26660]QNK67327.1 hypothetical protein H7F35_29950 [Variovorax sp. PAMC26660]